MKSMEYKIIDEEKLKDRDMEQVVSEKLAKEEIIEKSLGDKLFPEKAEFMPDKIKKKYEDFVLKVKEVNPEISEEQAVAKIFEIEEKYDYSFFWMQYNKAGTRELVIDKKRLLALGELNLLDEKEKEQLELIQNDFDKIVSEISLLTGEAKESCELYLDKILSSGFAEDVKEAKDILANGPKIKGFEETKDIKIPNKKISEFLENSFGKDVLRKSSIAFIDKDDKWLIKCDDMDKANELVKKFNIDLHDGTNLLIAENEEDYKKAEMYLEGVENENDLKHLYKLRATAGSESGFAKIDLHSFGVEKSDDFDYLKEHELLTSEDQKKKAYILGTIGHEVAHKIEPRGKEDPIKFNEYKKITEEEQAGDKTFVSDYVRRHKDLYNSNEHSILREDFAEAVRVYLTNSDYLKTKYSQRYKFIKDNYSFVKENSIVEILK